MISAWDVYWVMQLDSISTGCNLIAFVSGVGVAIRAFAAYCAEADDDDSARAFAKAFAWVVPLFVVTFAGVTFIPSSKTAAAMILVPALTSEQVVAPVTAEAKELYALAKSALRELGKSDTNDKEPQK